MSLFDYLQTVFVFIFVIGLILLFSYLLRKFSTHEFFIKKFGASSARTLNVEEIVAVDARRRLVLVRRGKVRHLLLLGGVNDLVIESDIKDEN